MKLRPFTSQETDELLNKFEVIANYAYDVNKAAYDIMYGRYQEYQKNFRWSPFKWKAIGFEEFTNKLNSWDKPFFRFYSLDSTFNYSSIFKTNLLKDDAHFFRGTTFCWNYYSDFMVKKGCEALTTDEYKVLSHADYVVEYFIDNINLHQKYRALVKYASRPFEFSEDDIGWLEQIEKLHNRALTWNSNSQKDNHTKS